MLEINYNSPVPIYEQLVQEIKRMIESGTLKPGDPLPPVRSLASQVEVAVNTVARAYQELARLNLIEGNRRKGSFVKRSVPEVTGEYSRIFKSPILKLLQRGLSRKDIEIIFKDNMRQIFD